MTVSNRDDELDALLEGRPVAWPSRAPASRWMEIDVGRVMAHQTIDIQDHVIESFDLERPPTLDEILDGLLRFQIDPSQVTINGGLPSRHLPTRDRHDVKRSPVVRLFGV